MKTANPAENVSEPDQEQLSSPPCNDGKTRNHHDCHGLRWARHLSRMPDIRLTKLILFLDLATGKRQRGAPHRRFKDKLKNTLLNPEIDPVNWETTNAETTIWKRAVSENPSKSPKEK